MNQKQRESLAKYLYDMSKGVHLAWIIGYSTGKISSGIAIMLVSVALNCLFMAYTMEVSDE